MKGEYPIADSKVVVLKLSEAVLYLACRFKDLIPCLPALAIMKVAKTIK